MRRRELLQATGGLGCAALAGCLAQSKGNAGPSNETESPTGSPTASPSGSPALSDQSFSVTGVEPGSETQTATVSFTDAGVRVTGTTTGNNGCYTAILAQNSVSDDALTVRVRAKKNDDAGDMCTQSLVRIDYEAVFAFAGRLPGRVTVEHDSLGDVQTVTETDR